MKITKRELKNLRRKGSLLGKHKAVRMTRLPKNAVPRLFAPRDRAVPSGSLSGLARRQGAVKRHGKLRLAPMSSFWHE